MMIRATRTCLLCLTLVNLAHRAAAADIRIWKFEATVVSLDDPQDLFGDVRLGDTVWGDFAYDVGMAPSYSDVGEDHYDSPIGFHAIRVAIDNPRTKQTLRYTLESDASLFAEVTTDDSAYGDSNVLMWQFGAEPPSPGLWPIPFVQFSGENVLTETSLPTSFNLDDWPLAAVFLGAAGINDGITASIFSITPVLPGDFNQDGNVDSADQVQWTGEFGIDGGSDADRDGDTDGGDFLVWQTQLGLAAPATAVGGTSTAIPEPSAIVLMLFATMASLANRRATSGAVKLNRTWNASSDHLTCDSHRASPDPGEFFVGRH
jgi:hypothetical protein